MQGVGVVGGGVRGCGGGKLSTKRACQLACLLDIVIRPEGSDCFLLKKNSLVKL